MSVGCESVYASLNCGRFYSLCFFLFMLMMHTYKKTTIFSFLFWSLFSLSLFSLFCCFLSGHLSLSLPLSHPVPVRWTERNIVNQQLKKALMAMEKKGGATWATCTFHTLLTAQVRLYTICVHTFPTMPPTHPQTTHPNHPTHTATTAHTHVHKYYTNTTLSN